MKKLILASILAGLIFLGFAAVNLPLKGSLVDSYFSKKLSGAMSVKVSGVQVILSEWGRLTFNSVQIAKKEGEGGLVARNGTLKWLGHKRSLKAESAEFTPSIFKETPFLGQLLGDSESNTRTAKNLEIYWIKRAGGSMVRLVRLESDDFRLKGGVLLDQEDRPVKLHGQVLVAPDLWRRLPQDLSKRFLRRSGDFRGLRFYWANNFIRVDGASGPLLAASWQNQD